MGILDIDRDLGGRELVEIHNEVEEDIGPVGVPDIDMGGH